MSTNIFNKKPSTERPKPVITSTVIIVLAIIVGISAISYFLGTEQENDSKSPIPIVDLSKSNPNQKILGQQIYNWTGKITEIQSSKLIITTTIKNIDGNYVAKKITALIDENTNIIKWDLTKPPVNGQPNKTKISYNDLSAGNEIVLKSTNDLNTNDEVKATDISLLITPNN